MMNDLYDQIMNTKRFFLIAGPCAVEDERIMRRTAEFLANETAKRNILFIFKSSYKKSNRTSLSSPMGAGLDRGMNILSKIKHEFGLPLLTDIHETTEAKPVAEIADVIQIPAFLSRQTELIRAAGATGKIVNIKKGQFMAPEDMQSAAEKVTIENNFRILLTERGTTFGYHDLVVDFRSFAKMHDLGFPVVYDVTHSLQRPSISKTSGGSPEYAGMMTKAALATGMVKGIFLETHPDPAEAISDASTMLELADVPSLLDECIRITER